MEIASVYVLDSQWMENLEEKIRLQMVLFSILISKYKWWRQENNISCTYNYYFLNELPKLPVTTREELENIEKFIEDQINYSNLMSINWQSI